MLCSMVHRIFQMDKSKGVRWEITQDYLDDTSVITRTFRWQKWDRWSQRRISSVLCWWFCLKMGKGSGAKKRRWPLTPGQGKAMGHPLSLQIKGSIVRNLLLAQEDLLPIGFTVSSEKASMLIWDTIYLIISHQSNRKVTYYFTIHVITAFYYKSAILNDKNPYFDLLLYQNLTDSRKLRKIHLDIASCKWFSLASVNFQMVFYFFMPSKTALGNVRVLLRFPQWQIISFDISKSLLGK